MRLRVHLILLIVAALAPVVILSAISLATFKERHREAALASIHESARAISLVVDRELTAVETALRVLAASDSLEQGDYQRFYDKARLAMRPLQGWTVLYDQTGQQLINTRVPYGTPLPGRAVNVDEFERIRGNDKSHFSDLSWGKNVQRNVVMVETPVRRGGGNLVLSHAIPPEYFNKAFAERNIPKSWVVGLFDRNGMTLARTHGVEEFVGKQARADTVDAIRRKLNGTLRHTIRGNVEVYDVFVHSPMSDWTVSIGAPVEEIDSAVNQAVLLSGLGLLTAIITASLVAWAIARRISASVQGAVRSAAILGRGGRPEPAPRSQVTEIDALHATLQESGRMLEQEKAQRHIAEAERNALLQSEQQARQQAEQQNRAKDQFLAMLGHELRNPLAAITSAVEILGVSGDADCSARARQILGRQARHLNRIVDDLLDVSRVLSGKVLLDKEPLDLSTSAAACVATLKSTGRSERHTVTLSALRPVWVEADTTRIEQVINNLLDNAVKYTPAGGSIRVDVNAEGQQAVLCVQDSGIGIPPELLPLVFDVFVQGERSLDRAQGGLGIGLALVRQLARLHGGTVECRSDGAHAGSSFTLRLPIAAAPLAGQGGAASGAAARGYRILLIDDHADARDMTGAVLEKDGHQVMVAAGGEEGLCLALESRPDLALVDIGLPGMDGYAVAAALRARVELAGVVLVALSGYGAEEDRRRSAQAGFDLHIVKPLTPEKFGAVAALLAPR